MSPVRDRKGGGEGAREGERHTHSHTHTRPLPLPTDLCLKRTKIILDYHTSGYYGSMDSEPKVSRFPGVGDPTHGHGQVPNNPWPGGSSSPRRPLSRNDGLGVEGSLVAVGTLEDPRAWTRFDVYDFPDPTHEEYS